MMDYSWSMTSAATAALSAARAKKKRRVCACFLLDGKPSRLGGGATLSAGGRALQGGRSVLLLHGALLAAAAPLPRARMLAAVLLLLLLSRGRKSCFSSCAWWRCTALRARAGGTRWRSSGQSRALALCYGVLLAGMDDAAASDQPSGFVKWLETGGEDGGLGDLGAVERKRQGCVRPRAAVRLRRQHPTGSRRLPRARATNAHHTPLEVHRQVHVSTYLGNLSQRERREETLRSKDRCDHQQYNKSCNT